MNIKIIKLGLLAILIVSVILGVAPYNKKTVEQTEFEKEISTLAETTEKDHGYTIISLVSLKE